jgi:hypothetical protein
MSANGKTSAVRLSERMNLRRFNESPFQVYRYVYGYVYGYDYGCPMAPLPAACIESV